MGERRGRSGGCGGRGGLDLGGVGERRGRSGGCGGKEG